MMRKSESVVVIKVRRHEKLSWEFVKCMGLGENEYAAMKQETMDCNTESNK